MQIGKQKILFSSNDLYSLIEQFNTKKINNNFSNDSKKFFENLGIKNFTLDKSDYEGAEIIQDLNQGISSSTAEV